MIHGCMTCCRTVWHFFKASDARKLERVQEQTLRAVYDNRTAEYERVLTQEELPRLVNRRLKDKLILMYKVKNSLAPEHICNISYKQFKN